MKKTIALSAAAVACGLALAHPSAAVGADSSYPGTAARLNLWVDDNYTTCATERASYDANFANDRCGSGPTSYNLNDKFSSFVNKTADWWVLYENTNYGGGRLCVRPHSHDNNIGNDTAYEDDISSAEKRGTTKPTGCSDTTGTAN